MLTGLSRDNPAFESDEFGSSPNRNESYQIPRVGLNRDQTGRTNQSPTTQNVLPRPSYIGPYEDIKLNSMSHKGKTGNYVVSLPSEESEDEDLQDYGLTSYLRYLSCFKALEITFGDLIKAFKQYKILNKLLITSVIVFYIAFFIAALLLHSENQVENYWCQGDGFLIILTAFTCILLFYFKIFKPLIGKKLFRATSNSLKGNSAIKSLQKISTLWYAQMAFYLLIISAVVAFLIVDSSGDRSRLISLLGIFVLILFGFLFSVAPRKIIWRQVAWGLGLQFVMGLMILRWSVGRAIFDCLGSKVNTFLSFSDKGSEFVFGQIVSEMQVFAFKVLTVILFFSFCIQILYYYGAMQWIVIKLGWLLQVTVGTTACESVNAAANIFLGQSEAPLLIKPFLSKMTKSELHAVMTGGFATIAGAVLAAYISFGVDPGHLLSASVMSAPAALGFSKLFYPEVEVSKCNAKDITIEKGTESNVLHAACEGVSTAIPLVANIAANLVAFIAFIAFVDAILNWCCFLISVDDGICTLSNIFGYVFMPLAWIMGVPWQDCYFVGQLIGTKTIVNEFVGYLKLAEYIRDGTIAKRSQIIATYALCGFSNITSIGIQLGGLGAMAPERRGELAQIALRAMIAGSVACFLTACTAGCLLTAE